MAILRSLRTLVTNRRNPNSNSNCKSFLGFSLSSSSSCSSTTPFASPFGPLFQCRRPNPILSPLSKWMTAPFHGPLFLSSPPWKLSQLATPLYLQSHVVLLPHLHAQALNLLRPYPQFHTTNLPLKLVAPPPTPLNLNGADSEHFSPFAESFVNLPNLISAGRLLSGPLLGWMVCNNMYLSAFIGLAVSGATDWLDGYMARKMGINSVVGSYLDPLADKVLIGCVALAMVDQGLLHPGLVGLLVLRDVALVGGALFKRASDLRWEWKSWFEFFNIDGVRPQKVEPLMLSKVNTVFQLVLVAAALLQPEFGSPETQSYIEYLSWLVASTTVASTAAYGAQYLSRSVSIMSKH